MGAPCVFKGNPANDIIALATMQTDRFHLRNIHNHKLYDSQGSEHRKHRKLGLDFMT